MQIYWDDIHKMAYATDASAYREIPMGVAYPETEEDLRTLLQLAREKHTHLIPRAGGTSIAGQVVGSGIVVDVSRYMNRILWIDPEKRRARVQPGVVRDELNKALAETGLFFSPETSTSNRCCIGGMVGNNSCGMHSLIYGSTRHHVVGLRLMLTDGVTVEVRDDGTYRVEGESELWDAIVRQWDKWKKGVEEERSRGVGCTDYRTILEEAFPDKTLKRRSCGYALDEGLESLTALIVGSEGTLALVTEIEVSLDPIPSKHKLLVAAHLHDLNDSWRINLVALRHHPSAVELMDGKILELCKGNKQAEEDKFFVQGEPAALVIAEFTGEDAETNASAFEAEAQEAYIGQPDSSVRSDSTSSKTDAPCVAPPTPTDPSAGTQLFLRKSVCAPCSAVPALAVQQTNLSVSSEKAVYAFTRVTGEDIQRVWNLRKAGLGVLNGMPGDAKPVGVIEDTAVAPERMEAYMHDMMAMLEEIGLSCVYYGHIATGELHLRPILNLKDNHDRKLFREVAERTAAIVKKHKGSLSGEHGDGRLRGEFIPMMYGEQVYQMMVEVKRTWDPEGVLNVGKIVETPAMDTCLRATGGQPFYVRPNSSPSETAAPQRRPSNPHPSRTGTQLFLRDSISAPLSPDGLGCPNTFVYNWKRESLLQKIERCNGAGDCRKSQVMGGTICPAYKVSRDELMTTRARANVLREVLTHDPKGWTNEDVHRQMDSCLACKACLRECSSSVDMTRIRSEVLQQRYEREGTPLSVWLVAHMAAIEALGAVVRPIYNFCARNPFISRMIKNIVGFDNRREIPLLKGQPNLSVRSNSSPSKTDAPCVAPPTPTDPSAGTQLFLRDSIGAPCSAVSALAVQQKKVALYIDEFTKYHEPELAEEMKQMLEYLGYEVLVPKLGESGRAAISKGCLKYARKKAIRNIRQLEDLITDDIPLVGIEPSCILSFRDEYPDLVPEKMRETAEKVGRNCLLYDEFIVREVMAGRIPRSAFKAIDADIWVHHHCHQKALVGIEPTVTMLSFIPKTTVHVVPSGCCGMAGSFGYEKRHYETSMEIGELVLFPALRKAVEKNNLAPAAKEQFRKTMVAAPGTSCRQQIWDGTKIKAVHPIEIVIQSILP